MLLAAAATDDCDHEQDESANGDGEANFLVVIVHPVGQGNGKVAAAIPVSDALRFLTDAGLAHETIGADGVVLQLRRAAVLRVVAILAIGADTVYILAKVVQCRVISGEALVAELFRPVVF